MTENRSFKLDLEKRTVFARERTERAVERHIKRNMKKWLRQMQEAADCQQTETLLQVKIGFWETFTIPDLYAFEYLARQVLHGAISSLGFHCEVRLNGVLVQWNDFR